MRISGWKNTLEFVIKSDEFSNTKDVYLENCQSFDEPENDKPPPQSSKTSRNPSRQSTAESSITKPLPAHLPPIDTTHKESLSTSSKSIESPSNKRQRATSLPKIKRAEPPSKESFPKEKYVKTAEVTFTHGVSLIT